MNSNINVGEVIGIVGNKRLILKSKEVRNLDKEILIKKMNDVGIDKLVSIYSNEFHLRATNMKCSSISLQKRKKFIIDAIIRQIDAIKELSISKKICDTYFGEKPKPEKKTPAEWVNEFTVGEDVLFSSGYRLNRLAKIKNINTNSITVEFYAYRCIRDDNARINQTYGYDRLIWDKFPIYGEKPQVVFRRNKIYKKGEYSWADPEFIEGREFVDYGN
jgi:hypothetical protein